MIANGLRKIFPLGDPPDYEPAPETSIAAEAARTGRDPYEVLYDHMLELDGRQLLMLAILTYSDGDLEALREMLEHPASAFGLGDGGAHCGAICDASMTTFLLTHWARDRTRGPKLPIEWVVRKMTRDTAGLYGLRDRGVVAPGMKADLNVIDWDRLELALPELVYDLPAGARRLVQRARGYEATLVSGDRHDARRRAHRRAAGPRDPRRRSPPKRLRSSGCGSGGRSPPGSIDTVARLPAAPGSWLAAQPAASERAARPRAERGISTRVDEPADAHVAARARLEVVAREQRLEHAPAEVVDVVVARGEVARPGRARSAS